MVTQMGSFSCQIYMESRSITGANMRQIASLVTIDGVRPCVETGVSYLTLFNGKWESQDKART